MRTLLILGFVAALVLPDITPPLRAANAQATSAQELVGLWEAKRRFGPDARGALIIEKKGANYVADMVGRKLPVRTEKGELVFDLPDNQGGFRGKPEGKNILGHWFRPGTPVGGAGTTWPVSLSPVLLRPDGPDRWRGVVTPLQDDFTFYLLLQKRPDGSLGAVLRNPERDFGSQQRVERLVREGDRLKLIGRRGGNEREVGVGSYDAEREIITLAFPTRGGSYDFRRDGDDSDFYPRGKNPGRYVYRPPPARDDGWPIGTLEEADIDRAAMERLVQSCSTCRWIRRTRRRSTAC